MDSPFSFMKEVVGDRFIGRSEELDWVSSNMLNGQPTVIISPPRYGKTSLVRQAFIQAQKRDLDAKMCYVNLFNVRTEQELYIKLANEALRTVSQTEDDWKQLSAEFFAETQPKVEVNHKINEIKLVFDKKNVDKQPSECIDFFNKYTNKFDKRIVVCLENFQNVQTFENGEKSMKFLLQHMKSSNPKVTYVLTGKKNEMTQMLDLFNKFGEVLTLEPIDEKLFADYIVRSFSKNGRVIKKEQAEKLCQTVKNYPYYVQIIAHIAWQNTKGFVTDQTIDVSEGELLDYCGSEFLRITDDLSNNQVNYLKAVIDGVDRFCSAESMVMYGLNSSANVARVRGALTKKEILEFARYKPYFIDPVYELWFKNIFMQ